MSFIGEHRQTLVGLSSPIEIASKEAAQGESGRFGAIFGARLCFPSLQGQAPWAAS